MFSVAEKQNLCKKPWKDALKGKEMQAKKWEKVWLKTKETYEEEFQRPSHTSKEVEALYMKMDRYQTQLYVMKRMTVTVRATEADFDQ